MGKTISIPLNRAQMKKIQRKLGRVCHTIEVDSDDLLNLIRYQGPQIIDFDEVQEKIIKQEFPDKECDFAVIDRGDLATIVKYMGPVGDPLDPND